MATGSGTELVVTGSDDGTVKIWEGGDEATKVPVTTLDIGCPVTSVCWSTDGANVYIGAIDNEIHVRFSPFLLRCFTDWRSSQVYDIRKNEQVYTLTGHTDTPTSLSLSPNGSYLLSPSLSSTALIHDVRPFSPSPNRVHRILRGAPAGFENTLLRGAWSKDDGGRRVAVGGADRMVCIWEVENGNMLYKV